MDAARASPYHSAMKPMNLEARGISASPLAFGCMTLGGELDDPSALPRAQDALDAALETGITFFDHANIYGRGHCEAVFGQLLKERPGLREKIVLQSKCGIRPRDESAPGRFDFSREHLLSSIDGILTRLDVDFIDILLLHRPDPLMETDEVASAFAEMKSQGKVKHFGVSNMSVAQMRFLQQALPDPLVVNQMEMSLAKLDWINQDVHVNQKAGLNVHFAEGLMEYCQTEGVQVQAWSPLARGRFTGKMPDDAPAHHRETADLVARMAQEKQTSVEAIVLGWLMKHPARIQPVIGTINVDRIRACGDAQRQAEAMTRDEWYTLYVAARGTPLP